ncbi:hypothetical protein [Rahnella aquatilis]|jgi:hypothetical protein|uniref:hypothetical protein n=1 Tax=Rahnella inusitata TaxID=58169 RepID=UPI000256BB2B|nr:hypothetical protein Q7S_25561 [Rahnella aquatilis HX2]
MQLSALKTGAAAGWAAVRLVLDIMVIGPVFIFSLFIVVNARPSPGAFVIRQAEGLVAGATRWLMVGRKGRMSVAAFGMVVQGGKQEQKHE